MPVARRDHSSLQFPCGYLHCTRHFNTQGGRKKHWNASHPIFRSAPTTTSISQTTTVEDQPEILDDGFLAGDNNFPAGISDPGQAHDEPDIPDDMNTEFWGPGDRLYRNYHPKLNAHPCDVTGQFLTDGAPPTPPPSKSPDDWTPYRNRVEFETAEFLYTRNQMSAGDINTLLDLWAAIFLKHNDRPPFVDCRDLYRTIDATPVGNVKWQSLKVQYTGEKPETNVLPWMDQPHDVWYQDPHVVIWNMLGNPDYTTEMDYWPYHEYATDGNEHQWQDFMSGDWAWNQAEIISEDPDTLGLTFVPVILGSNKTTVSVATGANDYYPLYVSIGNVHNSVKHAHCDAVAIIGFPAMPKCMFHATIIKLFHSSVATPEVVRFGDGHYWRVIYGLGPYIADYEEQVLLACIVCNWCPRCMSHPDSLDTKSLPLSKRTTEALIEEATYGTLWVEYGIVGDLVPFTNDFPRGDIHELIALDILHQLIKGTFKDHLVKWVGQYLQHVHGMKEVERIQADIDRRCHVPTDMVCMFRAFLEFCYLVRCNIITESTLGQIQEALDRFHHYRKIFESMGIVLTLSLPQQHSCSHYILLIRLFGAPNGLCSSITEMKHIKAVKEPWRHSSRYKALGKMLVTNQCLDKLAAARIDFKNRRMLNGTCLSATLKALIDNGPMLVQAHVQLAKTYRKLSQHKHACTVPDLSMELSIPNLYNVLRRFLFEQLYPDNQCSPSEVPLVRCPRFDGKIRFFNSASSTFYAPSDRSGIGGMRREHICACPIWRNEVPRYDCVFVNTDASIEGMGGMDIARVMCFFSFTFNTVLYPCIVVCWFDKASDGPDQDTRMWIVTPLFDTDRSPSVGIIHIDSIYRAAHLIPIYGAQIISRDLKHYNSYDAFQAFYVDRFADHHGFEIMS
ncbi:hypothetical protein F4604DRAFT_1881168 [Suillus subluteus]|nr:hypothetical protein F4604DRAFT_1881168 [Suillus subluteus]